MKFYYFDEAKFDYEAVIWADSKKKALDKYKEDVCDEIDDEAYRPRKIDVDKVFEMMVNGKFEDEKERKVLGEINELYKIITSKEPIVILHNCY